MIRLLVTVFCFAIIGSVVAFDAEAQTRPGVRIVVLGSSTAEGAGASDINNSWVQRFREHCRQEVEGCQVINLARGGYTTYRLLPDETAVPPELPQPDRGRNISEALRLQPDGLIINLPSNDASYGISVEDQLANYDVILAQAREAAVPVWITTTQPRNLDDEKRGRLMAMRDTTHARWPEHAVDFWTTIAAADGTIAAEYDSGDGIHLNDSGHAILFDRIREHDIPTSVLRTVKR